MRLFTLITDKAQLLVTNGRQQDTISNCLKITEKVAFNIVSEVH